ncbi:MAG TPA: HlyD family efflux transporter periplasmic adaptor subunit [Candidatus Paceibacterota bacterium]|nr:HlyD family efflux transporter periplasmic adaptor subunit [Candidatus Paceibacterota bacterium]
MTEEELKAGQEEMTIDPKRLRYIGVGTFLVCAAIAGGAYWYVSSKTVYIDLSVIQAPIIELSPTASGPLQAVFVQVGDTVTANQPVARVGDGVVESKTSGEIISVDQNIGEYENALTGQAVVATMVDPTKLRVVGHLDEDKGLAYVKVGDVAEFTVDAFGSKKYYGVVDEIGQTAEGNTTSNIFNQRPTYQFNVYVRFDPTRYPELKNGMSARVWVYVK